MGDSRSNYYDNLDDYAYLCKKHNQEGGELYSNHHTWIKMLDSGETNQTFQEYDLEKNIESLQYELDSKMKEVDELQVRLFRLKHYPIGLIR